MCSVTATALPSAVKRKVKISSVINQDDGLEIDILDMNTINYAYAKYVEKIGAFPRGDEELSTEQLSSIHSLFKSGRAPYCDFAIWGPHHHRLQKKIPLKGVKLTPQGEILTVELNGPADYESWRDCYAAFKVGSIMFEEISPARLEGYEKTIMHYHERNSRTCWVLIY